MHELVIIETGHIDAQFEHERISFKVVSASYLDVLTIILKNRILILLNPTLE